MGAVYFLIEKKNGSQFFPISHELYPFRIIFLRTLIITQVRKTR